MKFQSKNIYLIIVVLFLSGISKEVKSQTEISPYLFGQNAWMPDSIGSHKTWGQLDKLWQYVEDCNVKLVRIGGIAYDVYVPSYSQTISLIDSIRKIGAEPLIQVSYDDSTFTAQQAADFVSYINITMNKNVKFWSIANEPVYSYSASANDISFYFKEFATKMKFVDSSIKIVGPDLSWYNTSVFNKLLGGINDITGTDVNGNYYLDIVSFHAYSFNGTQTKNNIKTTYDNYLSPSVIDLKNKIQSANTLHSRTGNNSLSWAITEFNINTANPTVNDIYGVGVNSFINGQVWAEVFSLGMQYNAKFICPWSIHESAGAGTATDFGFLGGMPGNIKLRSNYYHEQLLANHIQKYFANYKNNIQGVKTFGNYSNDSISVVILNMNNQAYQYELFHNNSDTSLVELQIKTDTLNIQKSYSDSIKPNCTQVLVFNKKGQIAQKYIYCLEDSMPNKIEYEIVEDTTVIDTNTAIISYNDFGAFYYPNPFQSILNLKSEGFSKVFVYDLNGKLVYSEALNINQKSLELSDLEPGLYFIKLISGNSEDVVFRAFKQ